VVTVRASAASTFNFLWSDSSTPLYVSSTGSTLVTGTVGATQGSTGTNFNAWWTRVGDGTNGPVAVKASSTTPTTSDAALVVSLSPNSSKAQDLTYAAGTTAMTATTAGTGTFFSICGSATKTVRVQRVRISGHVATAAVYGDVVLSKSSTATSAGTATTLTQAPYDSTSAAGTATNVKFYTVLGTRGVGVGTVGTGILFLPLTGTPAATAPLDFTWRDIDSEVPTLRGTAQCLEASFGTTTTNVPTLTVFVSWTEK
jgi:hypothetical protein